jgi:hypothetical protein
MARPEGCQRREAVREFIILTGFSRCQGGMIGRVSRRPKQATPRLEDLGFEDKDFP